MKTLYVEMFMGHNTGLNQNYFRSNSLEMAKEYAAVIPALEFEAKQDNAKVNELESRLSRAENLIDLLSKNWSPQEFEALAAFMQGLGSKRQAREELDSRENESESALTRNKPFRTK